MIKHLVSLIFLHQCSITNFLNEYGLGINYLFYTDQIYIFTPIKLKHRSLQCGLCLNTGKFVFENVRKRM